MMTHLNRIHNVKGLSRIKKNNYFRPPVLALPDLLNPVTFKFKRERNSHWVFAQKKKKERKKERKKKA